MAPKDCCMGAVRRRTMICCRNVKISAAIAARDRNRSPTAHKMNLTRYLITDQHRPILGQPPANRFATGKAGSHLANAIARTTAEKAQETRLEYALEIEIRGQHDDVANCHGARPPHSD